MSFDWLVLSAKRTLEVKWRVQLQVHVLKSFESFELQYCTY